MNDYGNMQLTDEYRQIIQNLIEHSKVYSQKGPGPQSCVIDGQKVCVVTELDIGAHGFLPESVQDADVIHFYYHVGMGTRGDIHFRFQHFNLPIGLKILHFLPGVRDPTKPASDAEYVGNFPSAFIVHDNIERIIYYFARHFYPKMKIPYGCRIIIGDREILQNNFMLL